MALKPVPEGYHSVTPYLVVSGVDKLLDFVKRAFGAREIHRMARPDGLIMHAEAQIGDSRIMMGDAAGQHPNMPAMLYLYVPDVDATYQRALSAGAKSVSEPKTQFYGDRNGAVADPCGNQWYIATHVEDVSPDEMERRSREQMAQQPTV
ncbi:MAG TPA: VOC family protein [Bryobacteraceae bacterium]|nr:VOC family protein [Bryobacteraceae bacterium]